MLSTLWGIVKTAVKPPRWEPPFVTFARSRNEQYKAWLARPKPQWARRLLEHAEQESSGTEPLEQWREDETMLDIRGGRYWAAYESPCGLYHLCMTAEGDQLSAGCPEWFLFSNRDDGSVEACPLSWVEGCRLRDRVAKMSEV